MHSQKMSDLLHEAYQQARIHSKSSIELIRNLYSNLEKTKNMVRQEDRQKLESFMEGIRIID